MLNLGDLDFEFREIVRQETAELKTQLDRIENKIRGFEDRNILRYEIDKLSSEIMNLKTDLRLGHRIF